MNKAKVTSLLVAPAFIGVYFITPLITPPLKPAPTIAAYPTAVGKQFGACTVIHDDTDTEAAWDTAFWSLSANYNRPVWSYRSGEIIGYSAEEDSIVWDKPNCPYLYNQDLENVK